MPDERDEFSSTMRIEIPPDLFSAPDQQRLKDDPTGIQARPKPTPESRMARKEKLSSETLFSQLLESIYDGCLITDLDGTILIANSRVLGFLKQGVEDVKGMRVTDLISGADDKLIPSIRESLDNDRFVLLQAYCSRRDRTLFPAEISANILDGETPRLCFFVRDITDRKRAEAEREKLIQELQQAISEVKTLSGLLPICASCKRVRDDSGYWNQIESYFKSRSGVQFSHGLCPDCISRLYPGFDGHASQP